MVNSQPKNLTMIVGSFYIPKKDRGEDAHFFCLKSQVIGVADGVGACARRGIDAGEYARQLMSNVAEAVKDSDPSAVDPKSVLSAAFTRTVAPGASTACIISLAGNRLRAANIGDSGFAVIRGWKTVFRSPVQQCGFNTPCQLWMEKREPVEVAAEEMEVEVDCGDVVVAATDGLFDNMFPGELEEMVGSCFKEGMPPAMVARELAAAARRISLRRSGVTPFAMAAREAGIAHLGGGKVDDITVVVAYVVPSGFASVVRIFWQIFLDTFALLMHLLLSIFYLIGFC